MVEHVMYKLWKSIWRLGGIIKQVWDIVSNHIVFTLTVKEISLSSSENIMSPYPLVTTKGETCMKINISS